MFVQMQSDPGSAKKYPNRSFLLSQKYTFG